MQEREQAQNFEPLGADWTYESDGIFLLNFFRNPESQSPPLSNSQGYSCLGNESKASPSCKTCKALERWFDTLEASLDT